MRDTLLKSSTSAETLVSFVLCCQTGLSEQRWIPTPHQYLLALQPGWDAPSAPHHSVTPTPCLLPLPITTHSKAGRRAPDGGQATRADPASHVPRLLLLDPVLAT